MKKKLIITSVVAGGLAFGIAVPAQAAQAGCAVEHRLVSAAVAESPAVWADATVIAPAQAAWSEQVLVSAAVAEESRTVNHSAVYAERTVVDRAFVAGTAAVAEVSRTVHHDAVLTTVSHPAVTSVVNHPAVTSVVNHPAVTATDYTRYSWVGGRGGPQAGETPAGAPSSWQANGKKYDGSPVGSVQQGNGNGSYFYWTANEVVTSAAWDETVVVTAAWDETVTVSSAWTETVIATPAWDETIIDVVAQAAVPAQDEISHVEYDLVAPAWEEKVVDVAGSDAVWATV